MLIKKTMQTFKELWCTSVFEWLYFLIDLKWNSHAYQDVKKQNLIMLTQSCLYGNFFYNADSETYADSAFMWTKQLLIMNVSF